MRPWKQDSLRHNSSPTMYESSGSQFLTTNGIQSASDVFYESRFVMTFLTILVVIKVSCRLRLVLEGKTGVDVCESSSLEFLEKFLANNFIYQMQKRTPAGC